MGSALERLVALAASEPAEGSSEEEASETPEEEAQEKAGAGAGAVHASQNILFSSSSLSKFHPKFVKGYKDAHAKTKKKMADAKK